MRKLLPPSGGFFSSALLALMLLASSCHAQFVVGGTAPQPPAAETLIHENPTQVTFQRASQGDGTYRATEQVCYSYGCQSLPAWPGYDTGGAYLFTVWSTPRPAGAQTMWGTWTFQSGSFDIHGNPVPGLFGTNPAAHVAFLMRGVSTGSYNIGGAGYTVGGLSGFSPQVGAACPGISGAPETWWAMDDATAGNRTWGGVDCSPQLQEHQPYTLIMQAASDGFAWWLFDATSGALISHGYESNAASPSLPIIQEATGTTIGIVFADAPGTSWQFQVWNMAFGWF